MDFQNNVSQKQNVIFDKTDIDSNKKCAKRKIPLKLIVAIVSRGFASQVVELARNAGSDGAVIVDGRALGKTEKKFFGLRIEPETELVLIAVPENICVKVSKAIYSKFNFTSQTKGIVLVLPISSYYL